MEDTQLLEAVERYIRGEMNPEERLHFENLRNTNAEIDQLVVEHTFFLQQIADFGQNRDFKAGLHAIHQDLEERKLIEDAVPTRASKVVKLWTKYRRVATIAASIAGITAIMTSAFVWTVTPKPPTTKDVQELSIKLNKTSAKADRLESDLVKVKNDNVISSSTAPVIDYKTGGTGFLIEGKGLMITNAHVVKNSKNISVVNSKGQKFNAMVLRLDVRRDVAIIMIDDDKFKPFSSLPYGIKKKGSELAESVFTLGFPRDEIVYGEGYLSAKTGYRGDTLSCQISITANPGNSGGPIFNNNGEVIGILSARETGAEGSVFAVQSKYIYQALEDLKKNPLYKQVRLNAKSSVAGIQKQEQVKKLQDYVFMVKGD